MAPTNFLNQVIKEENIRLAFRYALNDRIFNDSYFNHIEIEYTREYQEQIIKEILEKIKSPEKYKPQAAYIYYYPKSTLCYRRMIYLPFKDLVVRYAFVIVLAQHLDKTLSEKCFANRRASGEQALNFLLEDYYQVSLKNFRIWQKKCSKNDKYRVLIRTDISAFYDSVSHKYLISSITKQIGVSPKSKFIRLFEQLLCVPVISYSHKTKIVQAPDYLHQGITIGNNLEGFLANLYLKDVDEAMENAGIEFGRYNDDMRIFAENREIACEYLLILQEYLLKKGLNLNSSKTKIAENKEEIEKLRTKIFDLSPSLYDHFQENEDTEYVKTQYPTEVQKNIDKDADELDKDFNPEADIAVDEDAKKFCKFLSKNETKKRKPEYLKKLEAILTHWQGSSKHASWLVIQSIYYMDVPDDTKIKAIEVFFNVLISQEASSYTKYRLLHHLIALRNGNNSQYRVIDNIDNNKKEELKQILFNLLKYPAFELNLICLYTLKILNASYDKLETYAEQYIPHPMGEPIIAAIAYLKSLELKQNVDKQKTPTSSNEKSELVFEDKLEERDEVY